MDKSIIKDNPYLFLSVNDFSFDIDTIINNIKNNTEVEYPQGLEKKFEDYFKDFIYDPSFDIKLRLPIFDILFYFVELFPNRLKYGLRNYITNLKIFLDQLNKKNEIFTFDENKEKEIDNLKNKIVELNNEKENVKDIENVLSSFKNINKIENSKIRSLKEIENEINDSKLKLRLLENEKTNFQIKNDNLKNKKIEYLEKLIEKIENFDYRNFTNKTMHFKNSSDFFSLKRYYDGIFKQFNSIKLFLLEINNHGNLKRDDYEALRKILKNENDYLNDYIKKFFYNLRLFLEKIEDRYNYRIKGKNILDDINKLENTVRINGIRLKTDFEWDNTYNNLYFEYEKLKRQNRKDEKLNFDYFYEKKIDNHYNTIINYLPYGYLRNAALNKRSNFRKFFYWWAMFLKYIDDKIIKRFKSLFNHEKETLDGKINFIKKFLKNSNSKETFLKIADYLDIEIDIIENYKFVSRYGFPYFFPIKLFKENFFDRKNKLVISIKTPEIKDENYELRKKYLINILTKLTRKNIEVTFVENLKFLN